MTPTATMQLFVSIADLEPNNHATEGGFDNFRVTEGPYLSVSNLTQEQISIFAYPNPFVNTIVLEGLEVGDAFVLLDMKGALLLEGKATTSYTTIDASALPSGMYFIKARGEVLKLVK
jgi:hypothetical protein